MKAKYDPEMSTQILEWIAEVTGESINTDGSEENFYEVLRTGALLCKLLNTISEGAVKKYNPNTTMAFKCMDNINSFLLGLDAIGVPVEDRFQTVDLWEQVNLHSVQVKKQNHFLCIENFNFNNICALPHSRFACRQWAARRPSLASRASDQRRQMKTGALSPRSS